MSALSLTTVGQLEALLKVATWRFCLQNVEVGDVGETPTAMPDSRTAAPERDPKRMPTIAMRSGSIERRRNDPRST